MLQRRHRAERSHEPNLDRRRLQMRRTGDSAANVALRSELRYRNAREAGVILRGEVRR
jgi:hypothetical protein